MAQHAIDERGVSVALACRAFSISQRCFRYVSLLADAAYRSEEIEAKLCAQNLKSHIHRKGKPLTEQAKGSNRTKSTVRVRVEHVFGAQTNDMGGTLVRTIGLVRAKAKIGMKNLAYNMRRLCQLRRINPNPA